MHAKGLDAYNQPAIITSCRSVIIKYDGSNDFGELKTQVTEKLLVMVS